MTVAQHIKAARHAAGLSQHGLALACRTTARTICRWESGENTPDVATLRRIAVALGVSVSTLIEE